jgi:hypothetical protein
MKRNVRITYVPTQQKKKREDHIRFFSLWIESRWEKELLGSRASNTNDHPLLAHLDTVL